MSEAPAEGADADATETHGSASGAPEPARGHRRYLFMWRDAVRGWRDRAQQPNDLSVRARQVAIFLSIYMRTQWGDCAVGLRRLAYDTGLSHKTVLRYLREPKDKQWLTWQTGRAPGQPTRYQARFPSGWFDSEPVTLDAPLTIEEPVTLDAPEAEGEPVHFEGQPVHMGTRTGASRLPQNSHRELKENSSLELEHQAELHREGTEGWPSCPWCAQEQAAKREPDQHGDVPNGTVDDGFADKWFETSKAAG